MKYPEELIFLKNSQLKPKISTTSLEHHVCVISGATSGVGLETVKQLAKHQAHLVMVCRNQQKAEAIKQTLSQQYHVDIDIIIADFSVLSDVRRAASEILARYKTIHLLINSVGMHATKKTYTVEGFETVFCVNHLAPFLFTALLLPRLKESAPSRVIQINSEGHRFNGLKLSDVNWHHRLYTGLRGYGASKTAQLLTTWEFAKLLEGSGVTINAMHPGEVRTNIGQNNGWLYRFFLRHVTWHFLKEPNISGEAIYYLASEPTLDTVSGRFFNLTTEELPAKHARNQELGQKIWHLSLQLTNLMPSKEGGVCYEV